MIYLPSMYIPRRYFTGYLCVRLNFESRDSRKQRERLLRDDSGQVGRHWFFVEYNRQQSAKSSPWRELLAVMF
ncbi:hypothetical protein YQ44_14315 [Janthinobacterium sp. 1_2014MBL_MicDiv]|nr:hypothetical protein YQ44_14315 [Janthinobacterium sp. 1_2014MBL_MicDiv]